jgi:hypothetical protein
MDAVNIHGQEAEGCDPSMEAGEGAEIAVRGVA